MTNEKKTSLATLWNKVHSERELEVASAIMFKFINDKFNELNERLALTEMIIKDLLLVISGGMAPDFLKEGSPFRKKEMK